MWTLVCTQGLLLAKKQLHTITEFLSLIHNSDRQWLTLYKLAFRNPRHTNAAKVQDQSVCTECSFRPIVDAAPASKPTAQLSIPTCKVSWFQLETFQDPKASTEAASVKPNVWSNGPSLGRVDTSEPFERMAICIVRKQSWATGREPSSQDWTSLPRIWSFPVQPPGESRPREAVLWCFVAALSWTRCWRRHRISRALQRLPYNLETSLLMSGRTEVWFCLVPHGSNVRSWHARGLSHRESLPPFSKGAGMCLRNWHQLASSIAILTILKLPLKTSWTSNSSTCDTVFEHFWDSIEVYAGTRAPFTSSTCPSLQVPTMQGSDRTCDMWPGHASHWWPSSPPSASDEMTWKCMQWNE